MGEVIVITSGKGGVGKTTATANIGTALALMGKRTLLIDTDIGLRNLDVVMGLENRVIYNLVDILEGNCRLSQGFIRDKRIENLFIIAAAQTGNKSDITVKQMIDLTMRLRDDFDFVLIDCPAGIEQGFKNAIAGADRALVVTTPEVSSVRDADRVIGLLNAAELKNTAVLVNKVRKDMVKRGNMLSVDDVMDILAVELIGVVPDDKGVVIATNRGETAVKSQISVAGRSFNNVARRLTGENIAVDKSLKGFGIWHRFLGLARR